MELNYAMSYRITTLEIEQAAIRAERARMAAEHADMIVRRDGFLRRTLGRLQARRTEVVPAATTPAPAVPATASPASAAPAPSPEPAAPSPELVPAAPIAELVPAASAQAEEGARASELVGCGSHAA